MTNAKNITTPTSNNANRPLKVFIIALWYPSLNHPLGNIFVHEQAEALVQSGMDVTVINANVLSFKTRARWGTSVRTVDGVKILQTTVPIYGRGKAQPHIDATERIIRRLFARAVKAYGKPDIIHIHSARYAGPVGVSLAKANNIPCILTEHYSQILYDNLNDAEVSCVRQTLEGCDRIIAVSPALAEKLKHFCDKEPIYIPNVLNAKTFHYTPEHHEGYTFVSTAWLSKRKGMDILLRAFAKLKYKNPYVNLKICGSGAELESLKLLAEELQISDSVEFTGQRTRSQLCHELNRSDCFVLASYGETFGVVYIEALACGLPIIATKCGGPEDIVNDSNGMLVDIGDVDALAAAMEKIYNEKSNYNSATIRNDCLNLYSYEVVVDHLKKIYQSCLDV